MPNSLIYRALYLHWAYHSKSIGVRNHIRSFSAETFFIHILNKAFNSAKFDFRKFDYILLSVGITIFIFKILRTFSSFQLMYFVPYCISQLFCFPYYPLGGATVVLLRGSAETRHSGANALECVAHLCWCERLVLFTSSYLIGCER